MKKIKIFIGVLLISLTSCKTTDKVKIDEVVMLKKTIDSLKLEIVDLNEQIDFMKDELQFRESEISYWGHKYDSVSEVIKTKK